MRLSYVTSFNLNTLKSVNNLRWYQFGVEGLNYSTGIKLNYDLFNNHFNVSMATLFSKTTYLSKSIDFDSIVPFVNFNSGYFQIPITIGWMPIHEYNFSMSIPLGVVPSFLVTSKTREAIENQPITTFKSLIGFQAGIDLNYTKNRKLVLSLQPNYVYYPKGFDSIEKQQGHTFQLFFGVGYMF